MQELGTLNFKSAWDRSRNQRKMTKEEEKKK